MKYFLNKFLLFIILINFTTLASDTKTNIITPTALYVSDVSFFNENNEKFYLEQFEGKTILLVFWATWCGTCINELPALDNLQKDFRKLPFEILAMSEDFQGIEVAKKDFQENNIKHLKLFHDYKNQLLNSMTVSGLPTVFLINPDGQVKLIFKGLVKWQNNDIREMILAEIPGHHEGLKNTYKEISLNNQINTKAGNTNSAEEPQQEEENTLTNNEDEKANARRRKFKKKSQN